MSNIAISVRNITKTYKLYKQPIDRLKEALHPLKKQYHKKFNALDCVSFEIKRGETVGIIGRNGSGKSTLLKLITGVLTPTSGRAIVHGRVSAILELGAGFNGEMTGLENIYLNNTINGIPESETAKRIQQIVEFAELDDFIHQPIKTYSSGMKARLAFAVAINVEPDILIVDEALSVGDAAFKRKCFAKMEQIREAGATILFVSHSEESIVSLCSRAIWISNGVQILDGAPNIVAGLYLKHINEVKLNINIIGSEYESQAKRIQVQKKCKKNTKELDSCKPDLENFEVEEFYNSALKPTSTIYYEEKGAKIAEEKITTVNGKKVNVLIQGREYIYSYHVIIFKDLKDIHFGMHMKDIKGNILMGSTYPSKNEFISLKSGQYKVSFKFTNLLNSTEIFCSAGIKSCSGSFIHRVVDNYFFIVKGVSDKNTGFVSLVLSGDLN